MSTRESFLISPIKSIQRGSVTATEGTTGTVTVTSVNTTKSVLTINAKSGVSTGGVSQFAQMGGAALTAATTITWYGAPAGSSGTTNSVIYWQLVEYK